MEGNLDIVINSIGRATADAFDDSISGEAVCTNNLVSAAAQQIRLSWPAARSSLQTVRYRGQCLPPFPSPVKGTA